MLTLNQVVCSHIGNCDLGDIDVLGNPHARHYLKGRSALKQMEKVFERAYECCGRREQGA